MAKSTETRTGRLFRALTRLLPFDFRADYGDEIEQVFGDQRREAGGFSRPARLRLHVRALGGLLTTALSEHLGSVVTLALTALAAVGYPAWIASRIEPARILRGE